MKRLKNQPARPAPKERLLYVEDEEANWEVIEMRLSSRYALSFARDSEEACEALRESGPFAAILMDVQLRGSALDGLELARVLRDDDSAGAHPGLERLPDYVRTLPIIFVTAFSDEETRRRAEALGAQGFVSKPIDFSALTLALARHHLARFSGR